MRVCPLQSLGIPCTKQAWLAEVCHQNAAKSTYIKVHLEGDRTVPLFAEGTEEEAAMFSSKPLIFVVIHSNAVAHIKVRDKKEGTQFYGQVTISDSSG